MRHAGRPERMEQLVANRGDQLLRTAVLLAGSREAGEDMFQEAPAHSTRCTRASAEGCVAANPSDYYAFLHWGLRCVHDP